MTEGVDYSVGRPVPRSLIAAGKTFVCRYLALRPNPKVLSASEAASLHVAGLDIVLNWEQSGKEPQNGRAVGVQHATTALNQADELGVPSEVPIYFSVDFDVRTIGLSAVMEYFKGVASVIGYNRTGVYGGYDTINGLLPSYARWGWQTYAWSNGKVSSKAHLYQYRNGVSVAGVSCDLDRALQPAFGQWSNDMTTVDLTPDAIKNIVTTLTNEKAYTDAAGGDHSWISDAVWNAATIPDPTQNGKRINAYQALSAVLTAATGDLLDTVATDLESKINAVGQSVQRVEAAVIALQENGPTIASLSDTDVQRIAKAVLDMAETRLAS